MDTGRAPRRTRSYLGNQSRTPGAHCRRMFGVAGDGLRLLLASGLLRPFGICWRRVGVCGNNRYLRNGDAACADAVEPVRGYGNCFLLLRKTRARGSFMKKRIVIIGGVAGGASAAARARRLCEDCEIVVFERGPHVSFANCGLPYFVGGEIAAQDALLLQTPQSLKGRFNLDVHVNTEVTAIDRSARRVKVRELQTGREREEPYDALILSTGAAPLRPPIPGIDRPNHF